MLRKRNKSTRERGQAFLEVTLMMPWILFLFIGVLDAGFYSYAAITTENAARVAANQIAKSPGFGPNACELVVPEMNWLPNVKNASTPCASGTTVSPGTPIGVCVGTLSNTASTPCGFQRATPPKDPCVQKCADCCLDNAATSALVAVTYHTAKMVPVPGILTNQLTLRRFVEMRIIQ